MHKQTMLQQHYKSIQYLPSLLFSSINFKGDLTPHNLAWKPRSSRTQIKIIHNVVAKLLRLHVKPFILSLCYSCQGWCHVRSEMEKKIVGVGGNRPWILKDHTAFRNFRHVTQYPLHFFHQKRKWNGDLYILHFLNAFVTSWMLSNRNKKHAQGIFLCFMIKFYLYL